MSDSPDNIAKHLKDAVPQVRDEAAGILRKSTGHILWTPNDGPQRDAYECEADELFYGGQAGGGKTELGLGLALTVHRRSLLLRRINKDAVKLAERVAEILGRRTGYNGQLQRWKLRNRMIVFSGCEHEDDKQRFKGDPHDLICVGCGTPVLMADGTFKAVESLRAGESVQTLEGPRCVKRTFPPRYKEAVRVTAYNEIGNAIGSQIQSSNHALLTPEGWRSLEGVQGAACEPIVSDGADRLLAALRESIQSIGMLPLATSWRLWHIFALVLQAVDHQNCGAASAACAGQELLGNDFSAYYDPRLNILPHALSFVRQELHSPIHRLAKQCDDGSCSWYGAHGVLRKSLFAGFLECCWSGNHQYDGHTHGYLDHQTESSGGQLYLHRSGDVERPNPTHSVDGGPGKTHRHSLRIASYAHPYTMEIRQIEATASLSIASYSLVALGVQELYDLEIEEVNHFITDSGFINKNCFDEGTDFLYSQYRFIIAWNRSADEKQRCRVVVGSNPPTTAEGLWVIRHWSPWLDPMHPRPAHPGELRWFTTGPDGSDVEVVDRGPHLVNGENVLARSRTYIPARLADNPDLYRTGYAAVLAGLPEELRRAYRDGNFAAGLKDDDFQVIPTAWIEAAQHRWRADAGRGIAMTAIGLDIAQGGTDYTVLAARHSAWYAPLVRKPGHETRDGSAVAAAVVALRRDRCAVVVDVDGGWGGDTVSRLKDNGIPVVGFRGSGKTNAKTRDRQLGFCNKRAEAWWRMREELDPGQDGGAMLALPPDASVKADLAAPRWELTARGIKIEDKNQIRKRLGRSPDEGDAIVMCLSEGTRARRCYRDVPLRGYASSSGGAAA